MKRLFLLLLLLHLPALAECQTDEAAENNDPSDDSYVDPATLSHRAGYERRADQASAANTIN
ncbi:MAG: hypothetical protein AB1Z18_04495, partial [Desulfobacterales bacterium]